MTELFTDTVLNMMTTTAEPEDYTGEDGLLYCGKCRTAKEAYFPKETAAWLGHDKHPTECDCQREKRLECESAEERRRHLDTVMELKRRGFTDLTMQEWTFAHDNGKCPQMSKAHLYVEHWEQMRENNYGLLLWGKVGTGKSYFAGCIANALMEQEISVRMTNFSAILNDLTASFEGRNEYIERLCRFPLLILDDFGMERGTEYGLEQVYNVIDSRYRSRKPLIVTTNLSLTELQNPQDTAHARIYDRMLEMCLPIQERLRSGKGAAYARWAKVYNLKQMAAALQFMQEQNITEYDQLSAKAEDAVSRFHALTEQLRRTEADLSVTSELMGAVVRYAKTRPVFDGYKAAKYSRKYLAEHEAELADYRAAKATMGELLGGEKLPKMAELKEKRRQLAAQKKALYTEYRSAQEEMRQAVAVKANIDHLLGVTDGQRKKEQER